MKKFLLFTLIGLIISKTNAQDIIYKIKGTIDNQSTPIDSILVENISNNTKLLFSNLPEQKEYTINLAQKALWGYTIENSKEQNPGFKVTANFPGYLCLTYNHKVPTVANLFIYNLQGEEVYENKNQVFYKGNFVQIYFGSSRFYAVKISSSYGMQGFKALGAMSNHHGSTRVRIVHQTGTFLSVVNRPLTADSNFSYKPGDSIRISVYKKKYYAFPKAFRVLKYDSLNFKFKRSHVDSNGISNAYLNLSDTAKDYKIIKYDDESGNLELKYRANKSDIYPGAVLTINLDTVGYLRKVVNVTKNDSMLLVTTKVAHLGDVFVNKSFKLNTNFAPVSDTLKSTSSFKDVLKALTDKDGFIHPVKIVFHNNIGKSKVFSVFKDSYAQNKKVKVIEIDKSLSNIDLYGKTDENLHFYIKDGNIRLSSYAVFKFDFKDKNSISRETKAKKGTLNFFEFYLESDASFSTSLALDLQKKFKKSKQGITLIKKDYLPHPTVEFIVPPGIPVWISFDTEIDGGYSFSSSNSLHAEWGFKSLHTLKTGGDYYRANHELSPIFKFTKQHTVHPLKVNGDINATARLEIYPRVDMKIYDVIGPFVEIKPYLSGDYNSKYQQSFFQNQSKPFLAWNSSVNFGLDLGVGLSLNLINLIKKDFGPITFNCFEKTLWSSPDKIQLESSVPQNIDIGNKVLLAYKVTDQLGVPVSLCPIYITGNGTFDHQIIISDVNGEASTTWTANNSGNNNISAAIYDANGTVINQLSSTIFVNNPPPPVSNFTAYPTYGTPPLKVTFIDQSTNSPSKWKWKFGDGSTSTEKTPTHVYDKVGSYPVTLIVSDVYGNSDSLTKENFINIGNKAQANFSADVKSGEAPLTVHFHDKSTNNPTSWSWDFDDGHTSSLKDPENTFNEPGSYNVKLTVKNKFGSTTHYLLINVTQKSNAPVAKIFASPTAGEVPLTVHFLDQSSHNPTSWSWDFDDGTPMQSESNVYHIFKTSGVYKVKLIATNQFGSDSTSILINVVQKDAGTVAQFYASKTSGMAPLLVNFTDLSSNNPVSWVWDFGDKSPKSTQKDPSHVYKTSGAFVVKLKVCNNIDCDSITKTIIVHNPGPSGTFTDTRDQQVYKIVKIGNQTWMAQNSNYKTQNSKFYKKDPNNGLTYGRLYTWQDAVDSVCPSGWHLPTDDEWKTLEMQIGMSPSEVKNSGDRGTDEGKKLKSKNNWKYKSGGGNGSDDFGFNGQPAGAYGLLSITIIPAFQKLGKDAYWWTSKSYNNSKAYIRSLSYKNNQIYRGKKLKTWMFSVRCVKNK